jgi:DNA-directed RNA polymerase beta subunit
MVGDMGIKALFHKYSEDMPFLPDGTPLDLVLTHLSSVTYERWSDL